MLLKDFYHVSYCTNIHPGENWKTTLQSLEDHLPEVKRHLAPDTKMGLGLRLSNTASEELGLREQLRGFKEWLDKNGLYVFTMNGFPYGNFHNQRVKEEVHAPDWTTSERIEYTKRLFNQLAYLMPEDISSGGISTNPIGYKYSFSSVQSQKRAMQIGAENMLQIAVFLLELEKNTGKYLHLDIEPEPDGLLENSEEVITFYNDYLLPVGAELLQDEYGYTVEEAEEAILRYINVCYDVCHFALAFEEPEQTFYSFGKNGIRIGKVQVSAALKILFEEHKIEQIWASLEKFNEPVYLHQVTENKNGKVITYADLPELLEKKPDFKELRAHFHVPIFVEDYGVLLSTQDHIIKAIDFLRDHQICDHFEVETYTWDVLPEGLKIPLSESIVRELQWLKNRML
jgi:hypothetical protein